MSNNTLFAKLFAEVQARCIGEDGQPLKSTLDGIESKHEDDHPICDMIDEAFATASVALFSELPPPLQVLAQTVLRDSYHEFSHMIFELGRQYEITGGVVPTDLTGLSIDDLKES